MGPGTGTRRDREYVQLETVKSRMMTRPRRAFLFDRASAVDGILGTDGVRLVLVRGLWGALEHVLGRCLPNRLVSSRGGSRRAFVFGRIKVDGFISGGGLLSLW